MKILLVEDDYKIGRFVEKGLRENSYTVVWRRSVEEANDAISESGFDLVILDLGLPDGDGIELLRDWRRCAFNEPVLILSARDSVEDRVSGLNLGADDYLPKPFSFEELLARVRSLFRRHGTARKTVLEHRGVCMDLLAHTVSFDGETVDLTNREYALLELFLSNRGRTLTRTQIGEKIWDASYDMQTNLIDVYVRKLRQHFDFGPDAPSLIKTVRSVGYMMP
ncbi:response regulator transcription factor [Coraliomargarita parva]|uniref:response regulator transcription factor n=1 Tax=Coraliomargarita parva TaxID=3014050 RepID=UPI0022B553FD|nr:response regulator transcription factor [Coraliomargarita parva]